MARSKAESHNKDAWMKDTLLLTCVLRLRVQPAVSYKDIANILLKTMSKQISGLAENPTILAKLLSTAAINTTPANTISTNSTSANSTSANSRSVKSAVTDDGSHRRDMWMTQWLTQNLSEDFMGAEFRGDQVWWRARNMDAGFVREMLRTGGLEETHVVASTEEMKLQILWRRIGDWRAGSMPDQGAEAVVHESAGIIGDRRI